MESDANIDQDLFKRAIATTLKAIGHREELEVAFTHHGEGLTTDRVRLQEPDTKNKTIIRGAADSAAATLRYHDKDIHARTHHTTPDAKNVFDALEQARCESLASRRLPGLGTNISNLLENNCKKKKYHKLIKREDAPLADAIHLYTNNLLGGQDIPKSGKQLVALWLPLFEAHLFPRLQKLNATIHDQEAFAKEVQNFLVDLELIPPEEEEKKEDDAQNQAENQNKNNAEDKPSEEDQKKEKQEAKAAEDTGSNNDNEEAEAAALDSQDQEKQEEAQNQQQQQQSDQNKFDLDGPVTTYRVFTKNYDEVVHAQDLCPPAELARLRKLLDYQVRNTQNIIIRLANRLQRMLMTQQLRSWDFDLEEGLLDSARLARVVINPLLPLSFKRERDTEFRDTVVTLLIDNSGSMRGRPITIAAMSADILARTLERCGIKTEILGFTTRTWKGGRAREEWTELGKPKLPGRLNELRHIIYKEASTPWRRGHKNLGLMLKEGLLKENIDGEALLWAHKRMLARPENRRILMVISDGAPVDDATTAANMRNYLDLHLRTAINWIEKRSPIELVAIGIGHDVTQYYERAVTISDVDQLGDTMMEQLATLFKQQPFA